MLPNPDIDNLAEQIQARCLDSAPGSWQGPYLLFLGEACAQAAGAPSRAAVARQALGVAGEQADPNEPDDAIFARFAKYAERIPPSQLGRILRSLHSQVAVPSFYQYLAELIRERYFPLILTMNFDTLLEQALDNAGVRSTDYRVTTFDSRRQSRGTDSGQQPLTHLVKLHGDVAQNFAKVTPEQIEGALNTSRQWIRSDLKGDLIMVGHILSDDPIDRWLALTPDRELWWVCEAAPSEPAKVASWTNQPVKEITGEMGRPQVFFPQLALRLLGMADVWEEENAEASKTIPMSEPNLAPEPAKTLPLADTLQNEILRNQSVLSSLEQESAAGERPLQVQTQIDYHKRQISHLEDRIRSLVDVKSQVVDVVSRIGSGIRDRGPSVLEAGTLEKMVQFVDTNESFLRQEVQKDAPNQMLVSAYLGATLTLADRLLTEYGDRVVNPDDVKRLASLAPSAAGKVVL